MSESMDEIFSGHFHAERPKLIPCPGRDIVLDRPKVMGILNVTPDSFYDGGCYKVLDKALTRAEALVQEGADIVDIGGESTRPGAQNVSIQEELDRVVPVVEAISHHLNIAISVDTSAPEVMLASVKAGAHLINDVRALQRPGALQVVAQAKVPICLMHMRGEPSNMQQSPCYRQVVDEVALFLEDRLWHCEQAGIERTRCIIDPGFGFGKTLEHNLALMRNLEEFKSFNVPIMVGVSRKSMIGFILNRMVEDRLVGGVVLGLIAVLKGASIIRTHDVWQTIDAIQMCEAVYSDPEKICAEYVESVY